MKKYYRRITERLPQILTVINLKKIKKLQIRKGLALYLLIFLCFMFAFLVYETSSAYDTFLKTKTEKERVEQSLSYWEDAVKKHPNYVDGYYNAAVYALKLNEKAKAGEYLEKALYYDPLFQKALELKKFVK